MWTAKTALLAGIFLHCGSPLSLVGKCSFEFWKVLESRVPSACRGGKKKFTVSCNRCLYVQRKEALPFEIFPCMQRLAKLGLRNLDGHSVKGTMIQ